jgi:hypothetical protein
MFSIKDDFHSKARLFYDEKNVADRRRFYASLGNKLTWLQLLRNWSEPE